ncbi:nitrate excretion transporter1, NRT1/ PTR family 2.7 [Hibiscus trionum]|nr:nitrate excretion transporter1, NRT1/ PTR family 2.7 [Hibiscus trionum]
MITEGDIGSNGSIARPWRLCSLRQVEDLKSLIRLWPLWSSGVFLQTPMAIQSTITVLQALSMDCHLGPNFEVPAASIVVMKLLSSSVFVALFDRLLFPAWQKLTGRPLTPIKRVGIGHLVNILSMAISAIVEAKRLQIFHDSQLEAHPGDIPLMHAWWLFPQLIVVGMGDALHYPGQVALYYQEFPASLRSTATAMVSVVIGIAYYISTALVSLIRRSTGWLPPDINSGRVDNLYWILVTAGSLNFIYFLLCAKLFQCQNIEKEEDANSNSDT